jgi:molybdopterin synthase catalytic subunit
MTERVRFARVSADSLSIEECAAAVAHETAGAIVTFAGIVRDHDGGRSVVSLEYEAHPSASDVLESVAAAIAEQFPQVTIAIEHRTGALAVGDLALAAAVSSAHRSDAFRACGLLIDAVKESVPIWKEQHFADGSSEWVGALG